MIRNTTHTDCVVKNACWFAAGVYSIWKLYSLLEKRRIRRLTEQFVKEGYVVIRGSSPAEKKRTWLDVLSPTLERYWQEHHPSFLLSDSSTWPQPVGGKAYEDTYTKEVPHMPSFISDNYEAQAILVYFCAGFPMDTISFGKKTHWRLRLLVHPLWALGLIEEPRKSRKCWLVGNEQSWHLVNWPAPPEEGDVEGCPVKKGAHVDGGENWAYGAYGLPPCFDESNTMSCSDMTVSSPLQLMGTSSDHPRRLDPNYFSRLYLPQLAILFQSETPGTVGPAEGMTGFYKQSHHIFVAAVARALSQMTHLNAIPWKACVSAVKDWSELPAAQRLLMQPSLKDGEALLSFGSMVHTTMRAQTPVMCGTPAPRVMQNLKVYFAGQNCQTLDSYLSCFGSDSFGLKFLHHSCSFNTIDNCLLSPDNNETLMQSKILSDMILERIELPAT